MWKLDTSRQDSNTWYFVRHVGAYSLSHIPGQIVQGPGILFKAPENTYLLSHVRCSRGILSKSELRPLHSELGADAWSGSGTIEASKKKLAEAVFKTTEKMGEWMTFVSCPDQPVDETSDGFDMDSGGVIEDVTLHDADKAGDSKVIRHTIKSNKVRSLHKARSQVRPWKVEARAGPI